MHDIDLKLVGWPWAEGNFSWAEPTAWACLALRRAGHGDHAARRRKGCACCSTAPSTRAASTTATAASSAARPSRSPARPP